MSVDEVIRAFVKEIVRDEVRQQVALALAQAGVNGRDQIQRTPGSDANARARALAQEVAARLQGR